MRVYTDGASRGNPGPSAIGVVVVERGETFFYREYIGKSTNNRAEYRAIIKALEVAIKHGNGSIELTSDSMLVVNQLNGNYKLKSEELKKLFLRVKKLESRYLKVKYNHSRRTNKFIQKADYLANLALDEQ